MVSLLWMQIKDRTQTIQIQGKIKNETKITADTKSLMNGTYHMAFDILL
jgi:hypothetical protein